MKYYEAYKDSGLDWLGEIPEHWDITKLKYLANIFNGTSLKDDLKVQFLSTNLNYKPYIGTKDIDPNTGQIDYNNGLRIPKDEEFAFRLAPKGSFLLCIEGGSAGKKIAFLDESVFFVNKLACFYSSNKYLYYFANSSFFKNQFNINLSGLISGVSINNLKNLIGLNLPSFEQTQIANYLDQKITQIDELIIKKEQLIQLLEEERIANINQVVTKGLNPDAPMKDTGIDWLGKIPEHWRLSKIGYETNVIRGASPRPAGDPELFNGDFLPWITVKEVTNAKGKYILKTETFLTKLGSEKTRILEPETLILSNSGATLGVPRITKIRGGINDGSVAFLNLNLEREYLYYFFITHTQIYREEAAGSGQPNLNTDIVKKTNIPIPTKEEQIHIIEFIEKKGIEFERLHEKVFNEIELLKEYKTTLISDVVTGKIDVREEVLN